MGDVTDTADENADMGTLLQRGKVKEVFDKGEPDRLHFRFTDNISAFDKVIPSTVPKKGESLCRTATFWFGRCRELGIGTHFISMPTKTTMEVRRVRIIRDYDEITTDTVNYLIPLEFISRHYVAGSLHDRLKKGEVAPEELGLKAGKVPAYGAKLPRPFIETTTKLEPVDRPLAREEALDMAGLTEEEYEKIERGILAIDGEIASRAEANGLIHVDGKKEFAFDGERNLMVIDTFGTADEDRFWDRDLYYRDEFMELSKEMVRQHYRTTGYHEKLMLARLEGQEEPPIPPLPEDLVAEVGELYRSLFERITGEKF
jgi:phosphoribosylaminoimidazole-succinocarboxamide synthase